MLILDIPIVAEAFAAFLASTSDVMSADLRVLLCDDTEAFNRFLKKKRKITEVKYILLPLYSISKGIMFPMFCSGGLCYYFHLV